jgi:hypothetical protein
MVTPFTGGRTRRVKAPEAQFGTDEAQLQRKNKYLIETDRFCQGSK